MREEERFGTDDATAPKANHKDSDVQPEEHLPADHEGSASNSDHLPPGDHGNPPMSGRHNNGRMVKVTLALSIIAVLGVLFLLFTRNQALEPAVVKPVSLTSSDGTTIEGTRVAFVRVDSVQNNYLMTIHFMDSIEGRFKSMERDLTNKQGELQKRVQNYYRDIQSGVLQETMALKIKEQIEKEGDQLAALEEGYSNRIADLQLQLNIIYFDTLWNFLSRHKETFGVDMVVGYQQGLTNIFFADQALDLTTSVIELMNAEYVEKNPGRKTKNKK